VLVCLLPWQKNHSVKSWNFVNSFMKEFRQNCFYCSGVDSKLFLSTVAWESSKQACISIHIFHICIFFNTAEKNWQKQWTIVFLTQHLFLYSSKVGTKLWHHPLKKYK
jgi:hypothetical protein